MCLCHRSFGQGYLAHHHDMIVTTAVYETRRAVEECSLVRQREWEVDSWRQTKKVNGILDATATAALKYPPDAIQTYYCMSTT